jgi:hypothetical protein
MAESMDNMHDNQVERWAQEGGPPRLQSALSGLYGAGPAISRELDERILGAAREQAGRRARMRWVLRYAIGSVAAAAAVILIVINLPRREQAASQGGGPAAVAMADDLNRDGKLDILDAYLLAKGLADKQPLAKEWDVNGDGVINGKDVDAVALAAVKLKLEEVR